MIRYTEKKIKEYHYLDEIKSVGLLIADFFYCNLHHLGNLFLFIPRLSTCSRVVVKKRPKKTPVFFQKKPT